MSIQEAIPSALGFGVLAGVITVACTQAVEHFGGVVGGVIASTPTTIILAAIGVARLGDVAHVRSAMFAVPYGALGTVAMLIQWRFWPSRLPPTWHPLATLAVMMFLSLSAWAAVSTTLLAILRAIAEFHDGVAPAIFAVCCVATQVIIGLVLCVALPVDAPKGKNRVSVRALFARGVAAAIAIFVAILLSRLDGPLSGVFATFPAVFTTIMVGVCLAQGSAVSSGAVGVRGVP